jgi:2'-5' RNA ligase
VPSRADELALQVIIDELAQRFGTPPFKPHMTLCSGRWAISVEQLNACAQAIARESTALDLDTIGLNYTDRFFQFFYLVLQAEKIDPLAKAAKQHLPDSRLPQPFPHLSLIYSDAFESIPRQQLQREFMNRISDSITFDRLVCVMPRKNNWGDIDGWAVTSECCLVVK